jgi:hypothetical protein
MIMKLEKKALVPDNQSLLKGVIDPARSDRIEYAVITQKTISDIIGIQR